MSNVMSFPVPRTIRQAPAPLGLYLRAGRNDHRVLRDLIAAGDASCSGLVIDPTLLGRHAELRSLATQYRLDLVLDPLTQAAATPGGFKQAVGSLPWSVADRPHTASDFKGADGRRAIDALADFVIEHGFTQVLAPTHLLQSATDPWLDIDVEMARRLQDRLARRSGASIPVIYSLAVPYAVFRDEGQRERLVEVLGTVPASAVWLKIDGLGSTSSGAATRTYIQAAGDFHQLDIPVIADQMGGMPGLALMAFGAVGGIAHGVTMGERFSASSWRRSPRGSRFTPSWRVYVQPISMMLTKEEAEALIGASRQTRDGSVAATVTAARVVSTTCWRIKHGTSCAGGSRRWPGSTASPKRSGRNSSSNGTFGRPATKRSRPPTSIGRIRRWAMP